MTPAGIEPTTSQALHREGSLLIITSLCSRTAEDAGPATHLAGFLTATRSNHASRLDTPEMNPPLVDV